MPLTVSTSITMPLHLAWDWPTRHLALNLKWFRIGSASIFAILAPSTTYTVFSHYLMKWLFTKHTELNRYIIYFDYGYLKNVEWHVLQESF